jgi:hypothetical protein
VRTVAEQSHKHEMNEAVRGDFARLRARWERDRGTGEPIALEPAGPPAPEPAGPGVPAPRPRRRFLRRRG